LLLLTLMALMNSTGMSSRTPDVWWRMARR
jgi:hypothetical protein